MIITQDEAKELTYAEAVALGKAAKGKIKLLVLHWTAGHYDQLFDDYHINIDGEGKAWLTCNRLTDTKEHCYKRNTGSVGLALCCAFRASLRKDGRIDWGPEPPLRCQIVKAAAVAAAIATGLGIDIDRNTVATHAEIAEKDGYGPGGGDPDFRWDLLKLRDTHYPGRLSLGGPRLRILALNYQQTYLLTGCGAVTGLKGDW